MRTLTTVTSISMRFIGSRRCTNATAHADGGFIRSDLVRSVSGQASRSLSANPSNQSASSARADGRSDVASPVVIVR